MRTGAGVGAVPSNEILPAMLPEVAGSTGLAIGAAGVLAAGASPGCEPPPQAAVITAAAITAIIEPADIRRDITSSPTVNYDTPPAAEILRNTRSCIHF